MILVFNCKDCGTTNRLGKKADDRVELTKKIGDSPFTKECNSCGRQRDYSVNDVYAKKGLLHLLFLCISIICIIFIIIYLCPYFSEGKNMQSSFLLPVGIAILPIIYFSWFQNQEKTIRNFNRYKTR